jgi:predicted TIM-barrel fold metal-dependent hydrolase
VEADDLILISVDDHICEPREMFDAHVPAKYKDRAPRVIEDEDGREQWWYGDLPGRNLGLNAVAGKPREYFNLDASRYDEMRPGCYDVDERVRDMNAGGQLAGLNFPNWTGFAGQVLQNGPDPDVNLVMVQAYNDWHVDEWCGSHPGRFIPCGILPLWDADLAAKEVERLADKGVHAVTFSENPEALKLATIHSDYWDPLYQACVDNEVILCCHLGSSGRSAPTSSGAPPSVLFTMAGVGSAATFGELLWAKFFDRFPTLRFSITEGDIGWMPYFVWRAEHVFERHGGWSQHTFADVSGPRERFRKNILGCFINEPIGIELIDHFNIDNVFWESDFPHSDGTWPHAPESFMEAESGRLTDEQINKITHQNAIDHYHFDPFAHRPREQCTAAALRAESPDVDVVTHVGKKVEEGEARKLWSALRPQPKSATAS